jgi:hypothetical protein
MRVLFSGTDLHIAPPLTGRNAATSFTPDQWQRQKLQIGSSFEAWSCYTSLPQRKPKMPDEAEDGDSTDGYRMTATRLDAASLFHEIKISTSTVPATGRLYAFPNFNNRRIGLTLTGGLYNI